MLEFFKLRLIGSEAPIDERPLDKTGEEAVLPVRQSLEMQQESDILWVTTSAEHSVSDDMFAHVLSESFPEEKEGLLPRIITSETSLQARRVVLEDSGFWEIGDLKVKQTPSGYWEQVVIDTEGHLWHVPRTNGYSCQERGGERMTTLGSNECFVGILGLTLGPDSGRQTVLLHSNPFRKVPVTEIRAKSPFQVINHELPGDCKVETLNIVHRPSVDESAIKAAEKYMARNRPEAKIKCTPLPTDKRFDVQIVRGEITVWETRRASLITVIK